MKHIESCFKGIGNLDLFSQAWLPEEKPKAVVVIVHGVLEHSGRYAEMASIFLSHRFAVHSYDHRGHGKSAGKSGHINRFSDYRGDLTNFMHLVREEQPDLPVFLYGHSMGAVVCLDYIEHNGTGVNGAIISAAPFEPAGFANPGLVLLAKVMSGIVPRLSADPGIKSTDVFADPAARAKCEADPLMRKSISARWGTENIKAMEEIKKNVAKIHTPILFLHGEADRCNAFQGAVKFHESVPFPDMELRLYPGVFHAMHYDAGNEVILKDAADWIIRHC